MNKYEKALDLLFSKALPNFKDGDSSKYKSHMLLQELIDKEDKYKWHDLRKDQNDMPKIDCAQYLIDTGEQHHYYRVATIIDGTFSIYDSEWNCFNEINAKRWKYIEEFEDE